jgi:hypothetical protein
MVNLALWKEPIEQRLCLVAELIHAVTDRLLLACEGTSPAISPIPTP